MASSVPRLVSFVVAFAACACASSQGAVPPANNGTAPTPSDKKVATNGAPEDVEPTDYPDQPLDGDGTVFAPPAGKAPQPWGIMATPPRPGVDQGPDYQTVVERVANMANDGNLAARVARRQLDVMNVSWEDTGRYQGSSVGPNISDMTLQVRMNGRYGETALMPVIRPPNFADRTGDVPADRFFVRVGNERRDGGLRSVALTDVLRDLRSFSSTPSSLLGEGSLLANRDSHFLVSAQAVFLPVPKRGKAEFNPAVFNYQSSPGAPAVLTLLVTRQGTSIRVIENRSDDRTGSGYGEELYFNDHGQRAALTAERRSDVAARIQAQGGPKTEDDRTALQQGADVIFLVQVPLMHATRRPMGGLGSSGGGGVYPGAVAESAAPMAPPAAAPMKSGAARSMADESSNVEAAVIGHGAHLGPYREGHGTRLVRDQRFPIRITVQFYKATSNGVASDADLDAISRSLGSVYEHADYVGSLVLPEGDSRRPTAWQRVPREWFPW